jgi:hypothetical protein
VNKMAKAMSGMNAMGKVKAVKELGAKGGFGAMLPGGMGGGMFKSKGSTATPSPKSRFKKRK